MPESPFPPLGGMWAGYRPDDFSPRNDPDGQLAEMYHRQTGAWPAGSRQHWEERDRELRERSRPFDRSKHPSLSQTESSYDDIFADTLTLRTERLRARLRIPLESLLWGSLKVQQEVIRNEARSWLDEMILTLEARVLREGLPPEHVTATETVRTTSVHVGPATWRDFWKLTHGHRWWARWWVRRHPARVIDHPQPVVWQATAQFDLEKYRLYPHADIRVRDRLGPDVIHFHVPMSPVTAFWREGQ